MNTRKYSNMLCTLERILGIRKQLSGTLLTSFVTLNIVLQTVLAHESLKIPVKMQSFVSQGLEQRGSLRPCVSHKFPCTWAQDGDSWT